MSDAAVIGFSDGTWINPPPEWRVEHERLHVVTGAATDFWRETLYGFVADNGHCYATHRHGDFTAQLRIRGDYTSLYDQAGIMVRVDQRRWIKAGIEFSDSRALLSSVLTVGQSDWATSPYAGDPSDFRLRVTVRNGVVRLQVSADGITWPLVRLAPFPIADGYWVGPMCCTPKRAGLAVAFSDFSVAPALDKELHDLS